MFGYILYLENGKFYVGTTTNIRRRLGQHKNGKGSKWTKLFRWNTRKYKWVKLPYKSNNLKWEKLQTVRFMILKGPENVRGGPWCQTTKFLKPTMFRGGLFEVGLVRKNYLRERLRK